MAHSPLLLVSFPRGNTKEHSGPLLDYDTARSHSLFTQITKMVALSWESNRLYHYAATISIGKYTKPTGSNMVKTEKAYFDGK